MREICQSGLEGGAAELTSAVPTPIKDKSRLSTAYCLLSTVSRFGGQVRDKALVLGRLQTLFQTAENLP
jgi:hypothetical protein